MEAEPSPVRERGALDADDHDAQYATRHARGGEGARHDRTHGAGDLLDVDGDHHGASQHVDDGHGGNQLGRHGGDGLHPADDDQPDHHGDDEPETELRAVRAEETLVATGDTAHLSVGLVRLEHVSAGDAEEDDDHGVDGGHDLPDSAHPALREPLGEVLHGTTGDGAVLVDVAVLHTQRALDELGGHTEEAGEDHPQRGTGSAQGDRDRDTGDVAEPDGAGHGGGQGSQVAHLAGCCGVVVFPADQFHRVFGAAYLQELEGDREDDRGGQEPDHDQRDRRAADVDGEEDDGGDRLGDGFEGGIDGILDGGEGATVGRKDPGYGSPVSFDPGIPDPARLQTYLTDPLPDLDLRPDASRDSPSSTDPSRRCRPAPRRSWRARRGRG
ncbi:hypothetical protein QE397_000463 [Rhodococcus sp. SORGH_AS 301]|nr:hypothetical protein [Rhodococcus sp. SORGH_AS_0301]